MGLIENIAEMGDVDLDEGVTESDLRDFAESIVFAMVMAEEPEVPDVDEVHSYLVSLLIEGDETAEPPPGLHEFFPYDPSM